MRTCNQRPTTAENNVIDDSGPDIVRAGFQTSQKQTRCPAIFIDTSYKHGGAAFTLLATACKINRHVTIYTR